MCERLSELTAAMRVYATSFDASLLTCADAGLAVKQAAAIEHMAATIKALAAARSAEAQQWKASGHRSAEEHLAHATGTSVSGAREALTLGRRLAEQPEVAAAARRGDLSPGQASAISDAVAADTSAGERLIEAAGAGGSLADLKDRCAEVKAGAVDLEARRAAIHRRRNLRSWTDSGGEWHLSAAGNPEHGAQVMAALAPLANQAFKAAREEGRREHPDAYRFDALVQLAVNATSTPMPADADDPRLDDGSTARAADVARPDASAPSGPAPLWPADAQTSPRAPDTDSRDDPTIPTGPSTGTDPTETMPNTLGPSETTSGRRGFNPPDKPDPATGDAAPSRGRTGRRRPGRTTPRPRRGAPVKLLVRVDLDAFLRGFPADGETCDLVGYGPISMSAVHEILRNGDPFVSAILTKGRQLLGVAHLGRKPTAHQRSALEWLYPTCAATGCPCTAHLEIDHRADWSQTYITLLDWLDGLCHHHHGLKTQHGWALVDGIGKRAFVPPTDPRHPRNDQPAHCPP